MHLYDLADQSALTYSDNVIHIRVTHSLCDNKRSCNFFYLTCCHVFWSRSFLVSTEQNVRTDCLFYGFLYSIYTRGCITGNSWDQDDRRKHLRLISLYLFLDLLCHALCYIDNGISTFCQSSELCTALFCIGYREGLKSCLLYTSPSPRDTR